MGILTKSIVYIFFVPRQFRKGSPKKAVMNLYLQPVIRVPSHPLPNYRHRNDVSQDLVQTRFHPSFKYMK